MQKIKLIWDFRGSNTLQMAIHYNKHIKEFFELKKIDLIHSGHEIINESHHISFAIIKKEDVNLVKQVLKPQRAFILK
jgi:hypothetical protein